MKEMNENLKNKIWKLKTGNNTTSCKWNDIFDTEEELINAMFDEKVIVDEHAPIYKLCRGYEYIKSFRRYYKKNNCLTEKQLSVLKRLAYELAFHIYVK